MQHTYHTIPKKPETSTKQDREQANDEKRIDESKIEKKDRDQPKKH